MGSDCREALTGQKFHFPESRGILQADFVQAKSVVPHNDKLQQWGGW